MFKKVLFVLALLILIYTRFTGIDWGLPYPMHPDERNMADAIVQLQCTLPAIISDLQSCFNPHFFAYGQFPLYFAYLTVGVLKFFDGDLGTPVGFQEATIALRIISAFASMLNVLVLLKIISLLNPKKSYTLHVISYMILTFSPYFIQFSHFGTTESLLMLFYTLLIYYALRIVSYPDLRLRIHHLTSLILGLVFATKVSSFVFFAVPICAILCVKSESLMEKLFAIAKIGTGAVVIFIIFSPHTFISFTDFLASINYESSVALGSYIAFYTRQFINTAPLLFQMENIFPYALGWPHFILAVCGFVLLPWKNTYINVLRFAFLVYFLPSATVFAKWSRFMAPIFPIMSVFAVLFLLQLPKKVIIIITAITIIPGIAYLSIYQHPDIRFTASDWIYKNIPANSKILSETANVVDIPIPSPNHITPSRIYQIASFNFYNLDADPSLQNDLAHLIQQADYVFIPSRRIFKNHGESQYPVLNKYYEQLFSGALGYKKVAEFSSYPRIDFFGKTVVEFPDEQAEETWSVFDHPVIRIYKKNSNLKTQDPNNIKISNLKQYQATNYHLQTTNYKLLIADTPAKWQQGLMGVRNKQDINGLDGMIFVFNEAGKKTFWNKNTVADLDVYWIKDNKQIGHSFLPSIEKSQKIVTVSSPYEVNKVIEIIK